MNKSKRDQLILRLLTKFKVCSRNQIAYLTCRENSNPVNVANRVLKRLSLSGAISQIPRERDKPYIYMPNPTLIHPKSSKINHYLKIVDLFIHLGCPQVFVVEPQLGEYRPDVYMKDQNGNPICVEVQLTPISTKKMQQKIDQFVSTYGKEHDARVLLIVSDNEYSKVKISDGFYLYRIPLPPEPYTNK